MPQNDNSEEKQYHVDQEVKEDCHIESDKLNYVHQHVLFLMHQIMTLKHIKHTQT